MTRNNEVRRCLKQPLLIRIPRGSLQEDFLVVDRVTTVDGEINFGGSSLEVLGEVAAEGRAAKAN